MALPDVEPSEVGLDESRLKVADRHIYAALDAGAFTASCFAVARHGRIAHRLSAGHVTPDGAPVSSDTLFDMASCTKPIVATTLLTMVEDGLLLLAETVADVFPEAEGTALGGVSVRQLATHSSGLPPWVPLYKQGHSLEEYTRTILHTPLEATPGTRYAYSDLGYILIGAMIAKKAGHPLDQCVRKRVTEPLGLKCTGYLPPEELHARCAGTSNCPMRPDRILQGEVHDANAHFAGGVSGHAGIFSTVDDIAVWATAMCTDGRLPDGGRLLGPRTLRLARESQIPPEVGGHSIGWFTPPNQMLPTGDILTEGTFAHTGFTGTMVLCIPEYELVVMLLCNRVIFANEYPYMMWVRRRVLNAVASAIDR